VGYYPACGRLSQFRIVTLKENRLWPHLVDGVVAEARHGEAIEVDGHATRHTRVVQSHLSFSIEWWYEVKRGFEMKKYEGKGCGATNA
jgi:predicted secreted hydrolase